MDSSSHSPSIIRRLAWVLIACGIAVTAAASSMSHLRGWYAGSGQSPAIDDQASIAVSPVVAQAKSQPKPAHLHDHAHADEHDHAHADEHDHAHADEHDHAHGQVDDHAPNDDGHEHDHAGHDHGHSEHVSTEEDFIELTPQARASLDLKIDVLTPSKFVHYQSMPATIIDWPGRTHLAVTAPMTGVVGAIYITPGEVIRSGQRLFSMRLTHQDLVKTQSDFLSALGRLDVEQREIRRLNSLAQSGAIAGKTLIQHEYDHDILLAEIQAERQAMLLHGLSESQIAGIESNRKLVREITIYAPTLHGDDSIHHESEIDQNHGHSIGTGPSQGVPSGVPGEVHGSDTLTHDHDHDHVDTVGAHDRQAEFLVTELNVSRGQSIEAGQSLGRLSDYSQLLIEGHAFQNDATLLRVAANLRLPLQAVLQSNNRRPEMIDGLYLTYIGNEVELNSRSLPFYVPLENKVERSEERGNRRYLSWLFKPGQRLQIRVPYSALDHTFVVPKDAVAEDGVERYVFVDHGDHFERRPVHVLSQDSISYALAIDGSIEEGERIATSGAHQLQMAFKQAASGPVDPHAGHTH